MEKKLITLLLMACIGLTAMGSTPKKFLVLWGQNGPKVVYDLKERPQVLLTTTDLTVIKNGVKTVYPKDEVLRFTYEDTVPMTQPGDANGDGIVNITDVTSSISEVLGLSPRMFSEKAVDINGDGKINIVDITTIINIILGIDMTTPTTHEGVINNVESLFD